MKSKPDKTAKDPSGKPKDRQPKQPRKISAQYLENSALYYLQRFATSSENFRRVMTRKIKRSCTFHKVDPAPFFPIIEDMIIRYERAGLLNDKVFAAAKVSSLRRQGKSKKAILAKLQAKGLGRTEIDGALTSIDSESVGDEDPDMAAALTFIRKKRLGRFRKGPAPDIKQQQKELAAMGRAGFSYEISRAALEYSDDGDDAGGF
ncbi:MAG: RecX family transcriptional regulator [Micavibrio sp.]|nr:RecX family transcriptional regulator [Micavibrio sp.]